MKRVVIALGGNALLRRKELMSAANQRQNVKLAAAALAPIAHKLKLVITHGNGPQVGLLALQGVAYKTDLAYPLDILDAETEGMIGYLIEQELSNLLPNCRIATLLTQIEVDPSDPAFNRPTKPIGPIYKANEAKQLEKDKGWHFACDGAHYRRVVPSPRPKRIFELSVIELLVEQGIIVICAGGGGIPTIHRKDGSLIGVEAVIDKDLASALLARELNADALIMLTDVSAVWKEWGKPNARAIRRISPQLIRQFPFPVGSMGPKVEAGCEFVEQTGGVACIGSLKDVLAMLKGDAGTMITKETAEILFWK